MSPPIAVAPTELAAAGTGVATASGSLGAQLTQLNTGLAGCGGMCGDDPAGIVTGRAVNDTSHALLEAVTGLVNGTARVGDAIKAAAANHANANAASDIGTGAVAPCPFPAETPAREVVYPPSAVGSLAGPSFAGIIISLVGAVCPNGHQDRLRAAAAQWRAMSVQCGLEVSALATASQLVGTQTIDEGSDITAAIDTLSASLTTAQTSCASLASQLSEFAQRLDDVHSALKDLAAKGSNPASLAVAAVETLTGDDDLLDDIRTVLSNFGRQASAIGTIIAAEATKAAEVAKTAGRYAGIVLYNVAADLVNAVASYGNAIQQDPLRMGTDIAVTVAGAALMDLGAGGSIGGVTLSATGIGAVGGVPLALASGAAVVAGGAMVAGGLGDMTNAANAHSVSPMAKKNPGGGGRGPTYNPAPKDLKAFPEASRATPKTPVQGGGGLRKRWTDSKGNIYEWDYQHGTVEKYNKRGIHQGEFDPATGKQTKPADGDRKVNP